MNEITAAQLDPVCWPVAGGTEFVVFGGAVD
jgi:hypothetical protein